MAATGAPCRNIAVAVATVDDASEPEGVHVVLPLASSQRLKKVGLATLAFGLVASLAALALHGRPRPCSKGLAEFQEKDAVGDVKSHYQAVSRKLHSLGDTMTKLEAQKLVNKTMKLAGQRGLADWKANKAHHAPSAPVRSLPNNNFPKWVQDSYKPAPTATEERDGVPDRKLPNNFITKQPAGVNSATAMCVFDVLQAFTSLIAFGDDINGMARSCKPPRPADAQVACQVDAPLMIAFMSNAATQLSLAASHCAETANIDSVCAAGVTGLVTVLSEIAGAAALAAPTCATPPPSLPTSKISELGDQTLLGKYTGRLLQNASGRRLEIAQGAVGNGIMCMVDVSLVAENLADMGLAINEAVNNGFDYCQSKTWSTAPNKNGLLQALCTVDIGGVIAYLAQSTTFISLAVVNCADNLDIKALCSTSVAGIVTGAAGIAPYGAAIHAACALNGEAKAATGGGRRLKEKRSKDPIGRMNKVMDELRSTLARMGHHVPARSPKATPHQAEEADLARLVNLVEPAFGEKHSFRGSAQEDCQ